MSLRVAIVGLGKIARDQHLPAIEATPGVELAAIASRVGSLPQVPCFATLDDLLASGVAIDAVALCTPPQGRQALAAQALAAGKHVLLEKPPGATVGEIAPLVSAASRAGLSLFATWHSRFAPAVEPLRALLRDQAIRSVRVDWKEDVRIWHPGQSWIFEAGGMGVFDPGINALSILTRILPNRPFLTAAILDFPSNKDAPIAASLDMADENGLPIRAEFDFLQTGPQTWDIRIETEACELVLSSGGASLTVSGRTVVSEPETEYCGIYRRFTELVLERRLDVDLAPLEIVSDAFLIGRRRLVEPFEE
jgi:D-galactose 1-dehydrogenase